MSMTAREGRSRLQKSVTQAVLGQDLAGSETNDADLDLTAAPPPEQWARRGGSVGVMVVTAQDAQHSPVSRNGSIAISRRSRYSITSGLDREFSSPQDSESFVGGQRRLSHKMSDRFLQRYIGPGPPGPGAGTRNGLEGSALTSAVPEDPPEGGVDDDWLAPESQATLVDKLSWARRFSTGPGPQAAPSVTGSRRGSRRFSQAVPGLTASLTVSFNRRESQSQTVTIPVGVYTALPLPSKSMDASLMRRRSGTGVVPGPGVGVSPNAAAAANAAAYAAAGIVNPLLAAVGARGSPGGPHGAEGPTNPPPPPPPPPQLQLPAAVKASPEQSPPSSIQEEPLELSPRDSRAPAPSTSPPPRRPLRSLQGPRRPNPSVAPSSTQSLPTATPQAALLEDTASTSDAPSSPPSLSARDGSAAAATTAPPPPGPPPTPPDGVMPVALALQLRRTATVAKGPALMGDRVVVRAETLKQQELGPETHRLRKALSRIQSFLRGDPGGPVGLPGNGAMARKASSGAASGTMQPGR